MKKALFLILTFLFAFSVVSEAQTVSIVKTQFSDKQLARAAGDSTTSAWIKIAELSNGRSDLFPGQRPDSITIQWVSGTDSTSACLIKFRARRTGFTAVGQRVVVTLDSAYQATTAIGGVGAATVASGYWSSFDEVNLVLVQSNGVKTPLNAATSSKVTARLAFFFTVRTYRP